MVLFMESETYFLGSIRPRGPRGLLGSYGRGTFSRRRGKGSGRRGKGSGRRGKRSGRSKFSMVLLVGAVGTLKGFSSASEISLSPV